MKKKDSDSSVIDIRHYDNLRYIDNNASMKCLIFVERRI